MKLKLALAALAASSLFWGACVSDCDTDGKRKYAFATDSVLTNYTGHDTLRFQLADAMGNAFDTLTFYGIGWRRHWGLGKIIFCGDGTRLDESEILAFKFADSANKNNLLYVVLTAMPEEDNQEHIWVSYEQYYPLGNTNNFVKRYRIHTSIKNGFLIGRRDTIDVLGKTYNNVVVSKVSKEFYPYLKHNEQKSYFLNTHGVMRIVENQDTIWNLIQ